MKVFPVWIRNKTVKGSKLTWWRNILAANQKEAASKARSEIKRFFGSNAKDIVVKVLKGRG